mmetsp:Transcript_24705/g.34512  ORF Transcript_24705/g.34512 Transcript_24705/m.34512 type:complete len:101 (-) Transcript_24705:425-727(-)
MLTLLLTIPWVTRVAEAASDWDISSQGKQPAMFDPSVWIAAVLFFAGGSFIIESIKSGGLQQDIERIRSFFVEKFGEKNQAADAARLEKRRRGWMDKYQL